jgi:thiamine pyrophosphokinase
VALVETAGRLDHILANLNALFRARSILQAPVYQLANNSISWLLSPGIHAITVPESLAKGHCSLVPIGEPCTRVLTTGLKWNLGKNFCFANF